MRSSDVIVAFFTDNSKAFDLNDSSVLTKTMQSILLDGFTNFCLSNRLTHFVKTDPSISNLLIKTFGSPQGSILRPILFDFYLADRTKVLLES